jgi:hypothetical protein
MINICIIYIIYLTYYNLLFNTQEPIKHSLREIYVAKVWVLLYVIKLDVSLNDNVLFYIVNKHFRNHF